MSLHRTIMKILDFAFYEIKLQCNTKVVFKNKFQTGLNPTSFAFGNKITFPFSNQYSIHFRDA